MEKAILIFGYVGLPFVVLVQPARLLWEGYRLYRPSPGRRVNRAVLGVALAVKLLSLVLAGYLYGRLALRGVEPLSAVVAYYTVFPFVIYLMAELIARQRYRFDSPPQESDDRHGD